MHNNIFVPALTSIRGIAALYVFLFHIHVTYQDNQFFSLFSQGELGVDLFFVLSGYIMAFVYGDTNFKVTNFTSFYREFISARIARVYPLHLVSLIFLLVVVMLLPGFKERFKLDYFSANTFVTNILLIQNWGITRIGWNVVSWSISAEWFMYLLFPIMLYAKRNVRNKYFLFAIIFLIIITHYSIIHLFHLDGYGGISLGGMMRVFFEFSLGFFVFFAKDEFQKIFIAFESKLGIVSALVMLSSIILYNYIWFLFLPAITILIVHLGTIECSVSRLLSMKIFVYLGNISFSLYMWHWIIINIQNWMRDEKLIRVQSDFSIYLSSVVMLIITITVAHYSFLFIEKPTRKLIKQMLR